MFPIDDTILDSVFRSYGLFVIACYVEKVYEYNLMQNLMWKALHGVVKLLSMTNVIVNVEISALGTNSKNFCRGRLDWLSFLHNYNPS